jgi:hypothetical protein
VAYPENESRLSDIALGWMVHAASEALCDEGLIMDVSVLAMRPGAAGLIGIITGDTSYAIGDRWPDTLATH